MFAALHAQRILEAWDNTAPNQRDKGLFEVELKNALDYCCQPRPANSLEAERKSVLESVAQQLSTSSSPSSAPTAVQVEAGLSLLRHLRTRVN